MRILACATLSGALLLLPQAVPAGGPVFDPFAERFAVGVDPQALDLEDGWPLDLWTPATADSTWFETARAVLRFPEETRLARLLAAFDDPDRVEAWRRAAAADVDDPLGAGPVTGSAGPTLAFFAALQAADVPRALGIARDLAGHPDLTQAERVVWSLRSAALGPETARAWPEADELLADCGPWDGLNTWSLAVALRRARGQAPVPADADEEHGRRIGRLARTRLSAADLAAAPYGPELKAALGAVSLAGDALADHFASYPSPPPDAEFQGWWLRGRRQLAKGDAATYEGLAARDDLLPRWRLDMWRRASERRLLAGAWTAAHDDLVAAYDLARAAGVTGSLRQQLDIWAEQALVCALAQDRLDDARRFLELADANSAPDQQRRLGVWRARLADPESAAVPTSTDRVDVARDLFRYGAAADAVRASERTRQSLATRAQTPPWTLWREWGVALTSQRGIPADRQAAARSYLTALAAAETPAACLAAALERLGPREEVCEALWTYALAMDARRLTGRAAPPRPSPVPDLLDRLRGSQADLHALLGAALWLGDMHGVMRIAAALEGTGLTRDQKRHFLYPLPAPGPVLDALLAAENDPALLLAIARNESAFEPAVRSRAGALGFMQVMPFHHPGRGALPGEDHWSQPGTAIARGDGLVTENRRRFGGDPYRLLAAYNAGPEAARRWERQLGGQADRAEFAAWIGYTETRAYVEKVLIDRDVYVWILSGAGD